METGVRDSDERLTPSRELSKMVGIENNPYTMIPAHGSGSGQRKTGSQEHYLLLNTNGTRKGLEGLH
jgi:hypothetical protein